MQIKPLFSFLTELSNNNDRAWFQAHKATYNQLRAQFELDVEFWARELAQADEALAGPGARKSVFRIYRDVRFSNNKDPYKTHFSAFFTASSKDVDSPSYYVQLGPNGQTLAAAGLYQPEKAQLAAVRQEIDYNAEPLYDLLAQPGFRRFFPAMGGDKLKKAPAGYPADHPDIDLLKHKSFVVSHELPDAAALAQADLRSYVAEVFRTAVPFCNYLREALG
ncbi:DUF2461 domain-containing protein [Hymenobacter saemangeumensis]